MKIRSRSEMWFLIIALTTLAWLGTVLLLILLFPNEMTNGGFERATVIVLMIGPPIIFFIAQQLRENTHLTDELQRLVNRDRLTDVATRDFFFERMDHDPSAYGVSLMVDIDHFKKVNDQHGHLVGDQVIKRVGALLRKNTRSMDIVCRFGGEEFVIFLHEASSENGYGFAERIRESIEQAKIEVAGVPIKITVSIGGSLKKRFQDIMVSINEADAALYRAKNGGRNQTVVNWHPLTRSNSAA